MIALDAKINFDDNALFRHKDIVEMRDLNEEDPLEIEASQFGLNYIKLDGNVGCMVNGAGLAMATMDIIKLAGGRMIPGQFGPISRDVVRATSAFALIMSLTGIPSVIATISATPASADSITASAANGGGTKISEQLAPSFSHASATLLKTGKPS